MSFGSTFAFPERVWISSHQSSPHRRPGGTQWGVLAENGVHEPEHYAKARTGELEDTEEEHAFLVENEVPVSVHPQVPALLTLNVRGHR